MTLPKGMSSGRGNAHLGSAIGKAPAAPKERKPLARRPVAGGGSSAEPVPYSKPKAWRDPMSVPERTRIDPAQVSYSTLKRKAPSLKSTPKKQRPGGKQAGHDWRMACLARNAYENDGYPLDEVTGERLEHDWTCHHVIEVSHLNAAGLGGSAFIVWNVENGMCLNRRTHERHHSYAARIPYSALRDHHHDFARMLDDTQGTDAFTARLSRDYPEAR